ncbi:MAG: hypothetical protein AAF170_14620 [Bacteroidota bacterium]
MSDRPRTSARPYLFPVPGRVLRDLLNIKAQLGEEFSDDEAAADLMLDLDLIEFYGRRAQPTGMLHAVRYYAERWSWPKSRVAEAWAGRKERTRSDGRIVAGAEPWIRDRIEGWRAFYSDALPDSARQAPDTRRTKSGDSSSGEQVARHTPDSARHAPDKQEQTIQTSDSGSGGEPARAHEDRPQGDAYRSEAVEIYERITGSWPALFHAEAIARRFASSGAEECRAWGEHVTTYHTSPGRNERNVPGIIQTFDEHLRREQSPSSSSTGAPARPSQRDTPRRGAWGPPLDGSAG